VKKLALVLVVLALGALASAQTFGFASIGGGFYCNYEQLINEGAGLWGGIDNNINFCGFSNSYLSGLQGSLANLNGVTSGPGVILGDTVYPLFGYYNGQWAYFTALKCNKQNKFGQYKGKPGWLGQATNYGFEYFVNYGYLSCSLPGKNGKAPAKGHISKKD